MSRWPNKYVIGLTGNIATGKSVVLKMLQHSGAYTIDADQLVHQAMMPGAPPVKLLSETAIRSTPSCKNEILEPTAISFSFVPAASGPLL